MKLRMHVRRRAAGADCPVLTFSMCWVISGLVTAKHAGLVVAAEAEAEAETGAVSSSTAVVSRMLEMERSLAFFATRPSGHPRLLDGNVKLLPWDRQESLALALLAPSSSVHQSMLSLLLRS